MDVSIRASDDDRRRVLAALERHTTAGRLDLDEFAERVDAAHAARTLAELAELTRDLPVEPAATHALAVAPDAGGVQHRELLIVFAVAGLTLLLLVAFMAISR